MPEPSPDISAFVAIRNAYAAEVVKAERDLAKAKSKLEAAQMKLEVADDMIRQAGGSLGDMTPTMSGFGKYVNTSLPDAIRDVVQRSGLNGISGREIQSTLIAEGFNSKTSNLAAAIHSACERLQSQGSITIERTESGKIFRRATLPENPAAA